MPMPRRRTETIRDLARRSARLRVTCRACGHDGHLIPFDLAARFGLARRLDSLSFRCRRCGAADVAREPDCGHALHDVPPLAAPGLPRHHPA